MMRDPRFDQIFDRMDAETQETTIHLWEIFLLYSLYQIPTSGLFIFLAYSGYFLTGFGLKLLLEGFLAYILKNSQ